MEEQKNNKGIISLLVIIIIILLLVVVLLVTGTINLNSSSIDKTVEDNTKKENSTEVKPSTNQPSPSTNNKKEEPKYNQTVRYYQCYETLDDNSEQPIYRNHEIELNTDGTARWRFGGNGSGGDNYKGTYTEDSTTIVLTLERDMVNNAVCDDNNSSFPCKATLTLSKNSDNTITSIKTSIWPSYTYKAVDKSELRLLD